MNCSKEIIKGLNEIGFEETTPIQTQAIPHILDGKDVVGQAQTGTGKTAAFAIPTIEKIDPNIRATQALILCPTRELAIQISESFANIGKYRRNVKMLPVFGGQSIDRQIMRLRKGVHIVIGTPGRVMDHIRRKTLKLQDLRMFILDEADEMLNMGFREDIETILESVKEERQTLLFSATMPKPILDIINKYQKDPVEIKITRKELTTPNISQMYVSIKEKDKLEVLGRFLDVYEPKRAIVFCNTKRKVDDVAGHLQTVGYITDKIHGDMTQPARLSVINKFKSGDIELLVATDVAARGLDIDNVETVFNFDIPSHDDYYVHRIGRTGRAGKEGSAISFVTSRDYYLLKNIMSYTNQKIKKIGIPALRDIQNLKTEALVSKLKEKVDEGNLQIYMNILEELIGENYSSMEIAAALLRMQLGDEIGKEKVDTVKEDTFSKRNSGNRRNRGPRRGDGGSKRKYSGSGGRKGPSSNNKYMRNRKDDHFGKDSKPKKSYNKKSSKSGESYSKKRKNNAE